MSRYFLKWLFFLISLILFACASTPKDPAVEQVEKADYFWEKMNKMQGSK